MSAWVCRPHGIRDHAYCRQYNDAPGSPSTADLARWATIADPLRTDMWPPGEWPAPVDIPRGDAYTYAYRGN